MKFSPNKNKKSLLHFFFEMFLHFCAFIPWQVIKFVANSLVSTFLTSQFSAESTKYISFSFSSSLFTVFSGLQTSHQSSFLLKRHKMFFTDLHLTVSKRRGLFQGYQYVEFGRYLSTRYLSTKNLGKST